MSEPNENVWSSGNPEETRSPFSYEPEGNEEFISPLDGSAAHKVYSDAHYEPAASTTTPPRYYTPPEHTARPVKKREKHRVPLAGAVCICLIFALLSGLLGGGLGYMMTSSRLNALELVVEENAKTGASNAASIASLGERQSIPASQAISAGGTMAAAQIYEQACSQVVGITTNVTTTNYFGQTSSSAVSGSGFILSEDGYIITNYHVIEYADLGELPITVILHDGTEYEATIVGKEDVNDIAVLKIQAEGLTPVSVGNSDSIRVGDEIYAVGNPLGELDFSMSTGHVSALDRVVSTEEAEDISMFQLDAAVNHGNSGGPVYNNRGEVIGVVTAKYSDTGVEGLGFAIPINDAMRIAEDLVANGYVTGKAYLGVWLDERYNAMAAQYYNMPLGAYVNSVESGSAAAKAGLKSGDIIIRVGEQEVEDSSDLKAAIRQYGAGDSVEITFYRAGESKTVTVTFDERTPDSGTASPVGED